MPSLNVFELVADSQQDVDFRLVDGDIKVHRGFLSVISPVFRAMFTHDSKEAKSGVIEVSDFKLTTVKNVINFCYGQDTGVSSSPDVIDMLHFADKYDIKAVVKKLEASLGASINKRNFYSIVQYAWDFDRDGLKTACGKFYRQNVGVCLSPEFAQMSGSTQLGVIAAAASIESSDSANE
uniref:BTB domain-containing protein n=1 Tax=Panagrellus redivivus TaxID=6233 RepID=A0A7E4VNH1_PANRE